MLLHFFNFTDILLGRSSCCSLEELVTSLSLFQVTVKPAISSHGEKDAAPSVSSPRASKGESVKLSRPSQKDTETSSQSSGQQSKTGLEPTPKSVLEASKAAVPSGSGSVQSTASSSLSPGVPVEKSLAAPKSSDGLGPEVAGGLVSTKDQQKKVQQCSTSGGGLGWFVVYAIFDTLFCIT